MKKLVVKKTQNTDVGGAKMNKCPKCGKKFLTKRVFVTCCYCGQHTGVKRLNQN